MASSFYNHYSEVDMAAWPYRNFTPKELASKGDGSLLVDEEALCCLQRLRELLGRPMVINSAYRDPIYNQSVKGAKNSMHTKGRAFDISLRGHDPKKLYLAAKRAGFTGFGFYRTFLHVDTGPVRSWGGSRQQFI